MPSKSRHGKKKHSFHSKKEKSRRTPPVMQQQPVSEIDKPAAPKHVAPVAKAAAPASAGIATRYPYALIELRRIGILAGVMLVILVVLALALP